MLVNDSTPYDTRLNDPSALSIHAPIDRLFLADVKSLLDSSLYKYTSGTDVADIVAVAPSPLPIDNDDDDDDDRPRLS